MVKDASLDVVGATCVEAAVPFAQEYVGIVHSHSSILAHLVGTALAVSLSLLALSAHLPVFAAPLLALSAPPVSPQTAASLQRIENLPNISFRNDIRLFTVMAALNLAGFDYESEDRQLSETRIRLRQDLGQLDPQLKERLRSFYQSHRGVQDESQEQAAYTSLALLLLGPPTFTLSTDEENLLGGARRVLGFENLVRELYGTAGIESLWNRYLTHYTAQLASYRPILVKVIQESLRYFRIRPRVVLDRQIIFMVDPLNAQGIVNARNLRRKYYVVVGATDDPSSNHVRLQHEYLHVLIDPLVEKFGPILLKQRELLLMAQDQPRIKSDRRERYLVIVAESLIESILLRLHPGNNLESDFVRLFREGLIFVPYFYQNLKQYETNDMLSFPSYSESLFAGIQKSEIREDEKRISTLENKIITEERDQLARQQEAQERVEQKRRIKSLLDEAGRLLGEKEYRMAQEKLNELLREDPGNGNAFFYLAQIASQEKEYELALGYYRQASEASDIPSWARAWALLRMGRLLAFRGRFDEARIRFDQVLKMEGELRGARQEAQESMGRLPSPSK